MRFARKSSWTPAGPAFLWSRYRQLSCRARCRRGMRSISRIDSGNTWDFPRDDAVTTCARAVWQSRQRPSRDRRGVLREFRSVSRTAVGARTPLRLARIETRDNGKLLAEMSVQLRYIPQWFRYFGGLADKIEGAVLPIDKPSMFTFTRREPIGVVAAIVPSHSPLLLLTWKLAPLLAAGNTAVIKPSEHASCSTLAFLELFAEAGFPPGVVNSVTGFPAEAGEPLVRHPGVAKIAFTGGEAGGLSVYRAAAEQLKTVDLALGGKAASS